VNTRCPDELLTVLFCIVSKSAKLAMQHIPQQADQAQINRLADPAQHYLRDCSRVLIFTGNGQVLFSKACQVRAMWQVCCKPLQKTKL
jgi:hypothetical protein